MGGGEVKPPGPSPLGRSRHGCCVQGTTFFVFGGAPGCTPWDRDPLDLWSVDLEGALDGGTCGPWVRLAFTLRDALTPGWPRHWLLPSLFVSEGHLVAFGGHRSTACFDPFGDPTEVDMAEGAGDAAGTLSAVPCHEMFCSREWRVLSTPNCQSGSARPRRVAPVVVVPPPITAPQMATARPRLPLLLGFDPADSACQLEVLELQLSGQEV